MGLLIARTSPRSGKEELFHLLLPHPVIELVEPAVDPAQLDQLLTAVYYYA